MEEKKLRVAIVGVGGMGGNHFNIYCRRTDIDLVAACDLRLEMLKGKAVRNGRDTLPLYDDLDEMLAKEKPDVLDICTPTDLHTTMAIKAMRAGVNVISEKPMALTGELADAILAAEKETGKFYMTAQVVRFMTPYRYLKQIIESEVYGKPIRVSMRRIGSAPGWNGDHRNWYLEEERSGHVMMDLMIHDIDFMHYAFGKPKELTGTYMPFTVCEDGAVVGSNCAATIYTYDGFTVNIETGWFTAPIRFDASFIAIFEKGVVELKDGRLFDNGREITFTADSTMTDSGINISNVDGYESEISYFLDCVREGKRPEKVTPDSSAYTIHLVEQTKETMKRIRTAPEKRI